ncbi:MAG TPA: DUF448 domain-containing protein [Candidatus Syntrophosphaera sp.]|jgi:hypothetical protein|nr:DUF448 domain-containing protein [Candidatus Syntrophosphaera sp.]HOH48117.1 DUF448 domain-containing protein [Candidatus Syntrophosphaera sp.]HPW37903.1 DUF448 domain-containing protein [Candidatus Syntrophosphaera sp.]HQC46672.1 DUF448 domain-containing protein [Candidatus Syntrophosphaera sp.]
MPNKNSHAEHVPQRTCVVCRAKREAKELLSFFVLPQGIVFDPRRLVQRRKHYVCQGPDCLRGLDKWKRNHLKRRFKLRSEAIFASAGKN